MRRVWLAAFAALFGVLMFATVFVAVLALSNSGTRWLIERALALSGVNVETTGIHGTLLEGVRVDSLRLKFDTTDVDVSALDVTPAWAVSFFRDRLVLERLAAASVRVTTTGKSKPEPLAIELPALPIAIDVRAVRVDRIDVDGLPEDEIPALDGRVGFDGKVYALRDLDVRATAYRVAGDIVLTPSVDVPTSAALTWRFADRALVGKIELSGTLRTLAVEGRLEEPVKAAASGHVFLLGEVEPRFDLDASLARWTAGEVQVSDVKLRLAGTLRQFEARAEADMMTADLPSAHAAADVSGSIDALQVNALSLTTEQGRAVARGRIERIPQIAADLSIDVVNIDPGLVSPVFSGALSGHVDLGARGDDLTFSVDALSGELNDAPFDAVGYISRTRGEWSARDVRLRAGPNRVAMTVDWKGERIEGNAQLDLPNLATLLPDLRGDLTGKVVVTGTREALNVDIAADSRALSFREWSSADARIVANLKGQQAVNGRATIARLSRDSLHVDRVELAARGSFDALEATLGWSLEDQRGSMNVSANHARDRWNLTIAEGAQLTLPGELWRLDRRLSATFGDGTFNVSAHCWVHPAGTGRVCIDDAQAHDDVVSLVGTVEALPLDALSLQFEDAPRLTGSVSGRWNVASSSGRWRGTAALQTDDLRLVQDVSQGASQGGARGLELPRLSATVDLEDDRTKVRILARNADTQVLDVALNVNGFDADAAIDGHATVTIPDLSFISTFTRRIGDLDGGLSGGFDIGGTLDAPSVSGSLAVTNARAELTEPRIELSSLNLLLRLDGSQQWNLRGTAQSGKGHVEIDGALVDPLRETRRFHAHVDATDLPASMPDVEVSLGGGVDVDWRPGLFAVKGRVVIPRAKITLSELPPGAVEVSPDVIVVDRVEKRANGSRLQADLELVLKDNVQFAAFGLSTHLTGTLRFRQSVEGVVRLNGTLNLIDGSYTAFGQTLAIDSGRLTYTGSPQVPYVDASASRTINEPTRTVKVGARIQGPADAVETTLTSDPAMSEAETLSYLVIGRPLSGATAQEGNNMMGAAIALGLKGAAPVIKEVTSALGLEELTATGGSTEDLTVIAGKRFSDRVFVRYSYQTFTRMSAILIELILSRRVSLEATASDIPAIDVIYKVGENN